MIKKDTCYIVMPAYNEEKAILDTLNDWYPKISSLPEGSGLIIADSGSTDNTHKILTEYQKSHPLLQIMTNTEQYHGPKVISLYKKAINDDVEFVFQTDSDGQTVASDFDKFWENRTNYDALLGFRNNRHDGAFRAFVENCCCFIIKIYLDLSVKDANAPFRLMRTSALNKFIHLIPENHVLPNILVTLYLTIMDNKVKYMPVQFLARESGNSMYDLKRIINYGFNTLNDFRKIKKWRKNQYRIND